VLDPPNTLAPVIAAFSAAVPNIPKNVLTCVTAGPIAANPRAIVPNSLTIIAIMPPPNTANNVITIPGSYTVNMIDPNGCPVSQSIVITQNITPPKITWRLNKQIVELNGSQDREQISKFIESMPIMDSKYIRNFLKENQPSLDLTQTVQAPSGELVSFEIAFGVEFFRPFF
jgi:hypothetical protein